MLGFETRASRAARQPVERPYDPDVDPMNVARGDVFRAGVDAWRATRWATAREDNLFTEIYGQVAALHELTGDPTFKVDWVGKTTTPEHWREVFGAKEDEIKALQQLYPKAKLRTFGEIEQSARDYANSRLGAFQEIEARGGERWDVWAAARLGELVGGFADPVNLLTLPLSAGLAGGIAKRAFGEAVLNMGIEAATQPKVQRYRRELGMESGVKEALKDIGMVGVGSFALMAGIGYAGKGLSRVIDGVRARGDVPLKAEARDAVKVVEALDDALETRPAGVSARAHLEALDSATRAVEVGRLPTPDELPPVLGRGIEGGPRKPIELMTRAELAEALAAAKNAEATAAVDVFGPEGAARYEALTRQANSAVDPGRADTAAAELAEMESRLTPEQEARLFGIGEDGPGPDELAAVLRSVEQRVDVSSPEALAEGLKYVVTDLPTRGLEDATPKQRVNAATFRVALEEARAAGLDMDEVAKLTLEKASARFDSAENAEAMLERFLRPAARGDAGGVEPLMYATDAEAVAVRTEAEDFIAARAGDEVDELEGAFQDVMLKDPDALVEDPRFVGRDGDVVVRKASDLVDELEEQKEYLEMFLACLTGVVDGE